MINTSTLVGNLGADPEVRYTNDGEPVTSFNLAFNSGKKEKANWIRVVCFKKLAETASEWLQKGDKIAVTGILDQNTWTNQQNEQKSVIQLIGRNIEFIKLKKGNQTNGQNQQFNQQPGGNQQNDNKYQSEYDDIPL
jgi:single-strand DNA-binding protein